MTLPNPCSKCEPFGGNWMEAESGMRRCDCARGAALIEAAKPKPYQPPVISPTHATLCAEMIGAIPFCPADSGSRTAIAAEISAMCHTPEQAVWLAMRMVRLHRKWPGIQEIRHTYWASYTPLDGIEAEGCSVFEDGIPSERKAAPLALAAPELKPIGAGTEISAAASLETTVRDLAVAKSLDRAVKRLPVPKVAEIPVVRITEANRITAADIERAVQELRNAKAREELSA